ncbi:toprim domain-containing protein [Salmonella enterica]|nr:toprim domain-containing protein [Salmonella enterica]EIK0388770.1 toprim domain-containing protein [Salmonella enterica]
MTIQELSSLLWQQVERVVSHLLPNGRRVNGEWVVGDLDGNKGQSLKISLTGKRVWCEFNGGQGGDLLDLWVAVRNIQLHQAMQEAREFLGVKTESSDFLPKPEKIYKKPERKGVKPTRECFSYLASRGISHETAKIFKVTDAVIFDHDSKTEIPAIAFPYLRDGELKQVKRLGTERHNGKKIIMAEADCEPCLFGWQAMNPTERNLVVICEGEIDAMTIHQYGFPALSVPFGGGTGAKQQWIDTEYENLSRFQEIFLCMDMDETGQSAAREIATRLGSHRCNFVKLPFKDANECLLQGVTVEQFRQCIIEAETLDPAELKRAGEFRQEVHDAFFSPAPGMFISPWTTLEHNFRFREYEITLVNGVNGHGKSQFVGHLALEAVHQGIPACIASMELRPAILLKRIVRQGVCKNDAEPQDVDLMMDILNERLWLFNVTGKAKGERILAVFKYAHKRYGVKLFVVDSLMMCGLNEDDYNAQKAFMESLCEFRSTYPVHVLLVTHPRKTENEEKPVGKMDVKGTGAITDLTDNLITIWRNKAREAAMDKQIRLGREMLSEKEQKLLEAPGTLLLLDKQRNGEGWQGKLPLVFNPLSNQFLTDNKSTPFNYAHGLPQSKVISEMRRASA